MRREAAFVHRLRTRLHAAGAMTYKAHGSAFAPAGWPDLWVGHRRWSGWIECKADGGTLTELQDLTLSRLRAAGLPALVLYEHEARNLDGAQLLDLFHARGGAG